MGREKILEAWYDEYYGISCVVKQNKYGIFYGYASVDEEDIPFSNAWDGQHFAELKADMSALKAKIKVMKSRALGIENAYKTLLQNTPKEDPTMQKLLKQCDIAKREIAKLEEKYDNYQKNYKDFTVKTVQERKNFLEKNKNKQEFLEKELKAI